MDGHDAIIESREGSQCGVHGGGGSRQCLRSTCISEVGESSLLGQRTVIGHLILLIIVLGGGTALLCCCCLWVYLFGSFYNEPGGVQLETYVGELFPLCCWSPPSKLKIREILGAKRQTMVEK